MKKQAIIILSIGTLLAVLGTYFAFFNANHYRSVPWWSFVLFFLGILLMPIGFAFFKVKKPKVHQEEPEVVIVPYKKDEKKQTSD